MTLIRLSGGEEIVLNKDSRPHWYKMFGQYGWLIVTHLQKIYFITSDDYEDVTSMFRIKQ